MSEWNTGGQGWPSNEQPSAGYAGEVSVEAAPAIQLTEEDKAKLINDWLGAKNDAAQSVETEKRHRAEVTAALFPTPKKGTQRYVSPQGYGAIKLVFGWNYSLGDKDKIDPSSGLKVPVATQVEALQDAIEALGERGALIADRVIRWKPELVPAEYELLAQSAEAVDIEAKTLIDALLTVTEASPQLTFEPPKAPK